MHSTRYTPPETKQEDFRPATSILATQSIIQDEGYVFQQPGVQFVGLQLRLIALILVGGFGTRLRPLVSSPSYTELELSKLLFHLALS